jgi:hypothetical protein
MWTNGSSNLDLRLSSTGSPPNKTKKSLQTGPQEGIERPAVGRSASTPIHTPRLAPSRLRGFQPKAADVVEGRIEQGRPAKYWHYPG